MARTIAFSGTLAILCGSLLAGCAGGGATGATATGGALPAAGALHGRVAAAGFRKPLGTTGCNTNGTGAFVGGTASNAAGGTDSAVLGGYVNEACGPESGIGTGQGNTVGIAENAFMGGGFANNIADTGQDSFLGAGDGNLASGGFAALSGGYYDTVSGEYGALAGGRNNTVGGASAAAGGGALNSAGGAYATVPGGAHNSAAGTLSFAAGYYANATQNGSFVWSDYSSSKPTTTTAANQFLARAAGGAKFFSNAAMTSGVSLAAGSGTWSSLSDRNMKTEIVPLDDATVLDKVSALPISEWSVRLRAWRASRRTDGAGLLCGVRRRRGRSSHHFDRRGRRRACRDQGAAPPGRGVALESRRARRIGGNDAAKRSRECRAVTRRLRPARRTESAGSRPQPQVSCRSPR